MSELLFYGKPVALNRKEHESLHFSPLQDFSFSGKVNSTPLTGVEFFEASRDYAILFNKSSSGQFFPFVLISLRNEHNNQLDEEGKWKEGYIPAFIRRYPFALTDDGTVCFDADSNCFSDEPGEKSKPLFTREDAEDTDGAKEEASNSKTLDSIIQFLQQYDVQAKRTQEFSEALTEKEMLTPFNVQLAKDNQAAVKLQGLYIIDEKKLNELDDETITEWFKKGWLAWSYAHLHSLGSLTRLLNKGPLSSETEEE